MDREIGPPACPAECCTAEGGLGAHERDEEKRRGGAARITGLPPLATSTIIHIRFRFQGEQGCPS